MGCDGKKNRKSETTVCMVVCLSMLLLFACAPEPPLIGIENPNVRSEDVPGIRRHQILIATTRAPSGASGVFYDSSRSKLGFAKVDVTIPPVHQTGKLERARRLPPDPRSEFVVENPIRLAGKSEVRSQVSTELSKRPVGDKDLLVFVHGYNTTLSDAVLQLAQFVEDTDYKGVPLLFSWASSGRTVNYLYDINSAVIARDSLVELVSSLNLTAIEGYDVVAHSMGTVVVMEALRLISREGDPGQLRRLEHIVLASPDIDLDLFRAQVSAVPEHRRRIVILTSSDGFVA